MADVVIVGGSEEVRLLLRGLVRLHRHRIVGEGSRPEALSSVGPDGARRVLLLDVDIEDPSWANAITQALHQHPETKAVLLSRNRTSRIETRAKELGIGLLLRTPFAVHELVEAIGPTEPVK